MELPNTKTQTLTIFIILLSQFFSIVIARGGHHNKLQNLTQNSDQSHVNLAPPIPSTNINYHQHGKHKHKHHHPHVALPGQQSEDEEFLQVHNKVRLQQGQPPFIWDPQIAAYARMWATKRKYDCRMIHSYGPYGENLFWGLRLHWTPTEIVQSWASEFSFYNPMSNECQSQQDCGHYTQIVWRDSVKLGCARVVCANGLGLLGVCSYDPPGNYENENPFTSYNGDQPVTTQPTLPPIELPPIGLPPIWKESSPPVQA